MIQGVVVERIINVAVNANLPPYQYTDGDRVTGIHIAILDKIALDKNYQIKYIQKRNDNECLTALKKGDVDAIVGISRNKVADSRFAFSDIMTSSSLCMVVRSDLMRKSQQEERPFPLSAAMELGTTPYTMIANLGITQYRVLGDQKSVFDALRKDMVDAAVAVKDSVLFQIDQVDKSRRFTMIHNYLGYVSYVAAVRAEDRELLRILNDGISRIRAGRDYEAILTKWIVVDDNVKVGRTLRWVGLASALATAASAAYVFLSLRIRKAMKRRVDAQTKEIQEANQKLEKQLHQIKDENDLRNRIIKYSPSAMILVGKDNQVGLMNKSAQFLTGVRGVSDGLSVQALPVFRDIVRKIGPRIFEAGAAIENERLRLGAKSYRCTMHQINLDGSVSGVLIMIQDVTKEEQQAQVEFEKEKNRTLTRLVAGIAHEIRNPLMSIRTFATVIGTQGDNRDVQQSFSKYVPDEVDRINRLIENMIQYAKPAKRQVRRSDVGEMIQECVCLISPSIQSKRIRLSTEIENAPVIFVDRDQIKQVLINLLINSVEAMERKLAQSEQADDLRLVIKAMNKPESVMIEVYDEGIGMTKQELDNCLDPFYTTKSSGTGLGLTLCKQYLSENAARLDLRSEEGRYTKITVTFPRSDHETANTDNR
jgi:polar amino acid transport system substrate-binding protein